MVNHPNRSQQPRRLYLLQGNICVISIMHEAPAHLRRQIGETWASGPVHNNKTPARSVLTDDVMQIVRSLRSLGYTKGQLDRLTAALATAPIGSQFFTNGESVPA